MQTIKALHFKVIPNKFLIAAERPEKKINKVIRLLDIHIGHHIELWIGFDLNEDVYEFKVSFMIARFNVELPVRWFRVR